jgi:two-component system, NarL family, response regulator NreC
MEKPSGPIRVLLVDDHTIVREGLRALLQGTPGIEVVGEASDGRESLREAQRLSPDVVVMDASMPGLNGIDATQRILELVPATRVLVLSMHAGEEYVRPALRAGASGYLVKGSGLSDLVAAIRAVAAGDSFVSPTVAKLLVQDAREAGVERARGTEELTVREREVLQLVAEGHSTQAIGQLLHLSPKTVEGHRGRVMQKLGVANVAGLVRHAIRLGLVTET